MTSYTDDLEALLDGIESDEYEERLRGKRRTPPVRTPTRRSSFVPRTPPVPASQGQVQQAARSLDSKIETLSNAVKALETRTAALGTEQDRLGAAMRKELDQRKTGTAALQADLQSTKTLAAILPMITQNTETATVGGRSVKVVTASDNQLASLLPFFLLMAPPSTPDGAAKGPFGDTLGIVLLASVLGKK